MAGAVLSLGVVAFTATLAVGLTTAGAASVHSQRAAGIADASALAAADAASGAIDGDLCERAAEVASASGAHLVSCEAADLVVTVTISAPFGWLSSSASARAGPPE